MLKFRGYEVGLTTLGSSQKPPGAILSHGDGTLKTIYYNRVLMWEWVGEGGADIKGRGPIKNVWYLKSIN